MLLTQVFTKTRRLTNTNSTTLSDSRLLDLINETYLDVQRTIANEGIDVFGAIKYTDLVANQSFYQLPSDTLAILRVEINYDDPTDNTKWKKLDETDLPNIPSEWFQLLKSQPKSKPLMDLFAAGFFVFPQPTENKTAGLRIWYVSQQSQFNSSTDEIPFQIDKYWEVLALGSAYRYFEEINHPLAQRKFEVYQLFLSKMIDDLKTEVIEPIKTSVPNYFNSGWI